MNVLANNKILISFQKKNTNLNNNCSKNNFKSQNHFQKQKN